MGQCASDDADSQPAHAQGRHQEQRRQDDGQVIEHWRQCGREEVLKAVEDAHDDAAEAEDDRRQQHDAHQLGGQHLLLERETGRNQGPNQWQGQHRGDNSQHGRDDQQRLLTLLASRQAARCRGSSSRGAWPKRWG